MNFNNWKNHFISNKSHFDSIDWNIQYELTLQELVAVTPSLQQFQSGESSEGKNLINSAIHFAQKSNDKSYPETIKVFIQEEQSHAKALSKFMATQNIPEIEEHWADKAFRTVRKGTNLERAALVLSCAEIIATEFYQALEDATQSPTLKAICKQILIDEEQHINFQSETFRMIYENRSWIKNTISRGLHFGILLGTIAGVYFIHKPVFKLGKMNFWSFSIGSIREFLRLQERIVKERTNTLYTTESSSFVTQ